MSHEIKTPLTGIIGSVDALEKRYQTWARLCSYRRPCYAFDLGDGRHVTACLDGSKWTFVVPGYSVEKLLPSASRERAPRRPDAWIARYNQEKRIIGGLIE